MVIDQLYDDKPSLASCSLTCTLWFPRSRHLLFRKVRRRLRREMDVHLRNFAAFLSKSPSVAALVVDFEIYHTRSNPDTPLIVEEDDLSAVVKALPSLQTLTVGVFLLELWPGQTPLLDAVLQLTRLHTLNLSTRKVITHLRGVLPPADLPPCRLRCLTLTFWGLADPLFGVYGAFLGRNGVGESLEELTVVLNTYHSRQITSAHSDVRRE